MKNVVSASVLEELTTELQSSKYSLLIDESTDISGMKHICLCVKFFGEKCSCIKTEFLALIPVTSATGEVLFNAISSYLKRIDVDIGNCIGFSSDGDSNVCGRKNSVP